MTYTHQPGRDEGLSLLLSGPLSFNFWVGEILLGVVVPIVLLLRDSLRARRWIRMLALALVVGGVVAYRWDTTMVGQLVVLTYLPSRVEAVFAVYAPSLIEYITGLGVVAYGLLAFTLGVRYLKVVDHGRVEAPRGERQPFPATAGAD